MEFMFNCIRNALPERWEGKADIERVLVGTQHRGRDTVLLLRGLQKHLTIICPLNETCGIKF